MNTALLIKHRWDEGDRTCYLCGKRITKISELELDHVKARSKGGKKLKVSHHVCNRLKGVLSVSEFRKIVKYKKRKIKRSKERIIIDNILKPKSL